MADHAPSRTPWRAPIAAALGLAAALAACGGGELLAIVAYVGPIGGQWQGENDPQTTLNADDASLVFTDGQAVGNGTPGLFGSERLFHTAFRADANLALAPGDAIGSCTSGALTWAVDQQAVTLTQGGRTCATGRFTSEIRIAFDGGGAIVNTVAFFADLVDGIWVDTADASHRLRFTAATAGCEYTGTPAVRKGVFTGLAFNGQPASIAFTIDRAGAPDPVLSNAVFAGASRFTVDASSGGTLTFERRRNTDNLDCS